MKSSQYIRVWVFSFIYSLLTGLLIQLVVLRYIFPQWNAGDGMLIGLDSSYYNGIALSLSEQMRLHGWAAWQLFPNKQVVSGISAIFYYLIAPKPWSVLPLHALLNASACTALFYVLTMIAGEQKYLSLAILPFLLFPSALQWNAQLNNDVYSVPGVIFFITGWAGLFAFQTAGWKKNGLHLGLMAAGFGLVYLTRPYLGLPFIVLNVVLFAAYAVTWLPGLLKSFRENRAGLVWLLLLGLLMAGMLPLSQKGLLKGAGWEKRAASCTSASLEPQCHWQVSKWLPGGLDYQLKRLSMSRYMNTLDWQQGRSNLDTQVVFYNAAALIEYLPRALQISIFAPFPDAWFGSGSLPSATLMRRVAGVEMLVVYFCLAGLLLGGYFFRKRGAFWVALAVCAAFLLLYGLVVPNIGTLYRFRYPFLMYLVTFGLAGWQQVWGRLRRGRVG